jgi:hypothetical protein
MPPAERDAWLKDVAARRLDALAEIAVKYARPWFDFIPNLAQTVSEGWYVSYSG